MEKNLNKMCRQATLPMVSHAYNYIWVLICIFSLWLHKHHGGFLQKLPFTHCCALCCLWTEHRNTGWAAKMPDKEWIPKLPKKYDAIMSWESVRVPEESANEKTSWNNCKKHVHAKHASVKTRHGKHTGVPFIVKLHKEHCTLMQFY